MKFCRIALAVGAVALCLAVSPPAALAQNQTWSWGGVDQDWDNPNNWSGGAVPVKDVDDPEVTDHAIINTATAGEFPIISATLAGGNPQDIFVGGGGVGRLDHTAGVAGTGDGNWGFVGEAGGMGTYNLSDTSTTGGVNTGYGTGSGDFSAGRLYAGIGGGSVGTINVNTTGTLTTTDGGESLVVGTAGPAGSGTINLDNGTINSLGQIWIGRDGPGTLNMSGGTTNSGAVFIVGLDGSATGEVNLTGGDISSASEFQVGASGTGTVNMSGGSISSDDWFVVGRNSGSMGEFNMTGGNVSVSVGAANDRFLVVGSFGGATGVANVSGGTIDTTAGAGAYIGEGGTGTLNLSGTATLLGGALRIGLNDGGIGLTEISGSGVTVDITDLSLGLNSDGLDTTALGTLSFVADSIGVSTIVASGDVNLSSPDGDLLLVDLTAYTGAHVDIQLVDGATSAGEFTGLDQGALAAVDGNANAYTIDYSVAGDVWLRARLIPEPTSLLLLGMASLAFVGRRRR